jgi:transcriptional regulator with XRE-family HTH domain
MGDNFPSWLNNEIRIRDWSIREFGRRTGISHTHAARIINGEVDPSADLCQEIARAFGVSVAEVFRRAGYLPDEAPADADEAELQELYMAAKLLDHKGRRQVREYIEFCYQKQIERERTANDGSLPATADA